VGAGATIVVGDGPAACGSMPGKKLAVGDTVRVKFGIKCPTHNWGKVSPGEVGTVVAIQGKKCKVDFPADCKWTGVLKEMEYMGNPAGEAVVGMYEHMLKSRQFADVTFVLADGEEMAHRAVLAASSEVFHAMFLHSMQEGQGGKVELTDLKRASMRVFLRLIYTGHVDPHDWREDVQPEEQDNERRVVARQVPPCAGSTGSTGSMREHGHAPDRPEAPLVEQNAGHLHVTSQTHLNETVQEDSDQGQDPSESEDQSEDEDEDDEYATGDDDDEIATACEKKVPLEIIFDVAGLAKKYLVDRVLQSAIEALKSRLHQAWVHGDVTVFEETLAVAIRLDIGAVRLAAMELARRSRAIRTCFKLRKFRPEVQQELQALWAPAKRKAKRTWLT